MIPTWFDAAFSLRLTLTMLHFLWQGTLLALLAATAVIVLRHKSAQSRYAMLLVVLGLMAACPMVTYIALGATSRGQKVTRPADLLANSSALGPSRNDKAIAPSDLNNAAHAPPTIERPARIAASVIQPDAWSLQPYAPAVTAIYFLGMALMFARLALALYGGRGLGRAASLVEQPDLLAAVSRMAARLGLSYTPTVAFCHRAAVPTIIGVVRPMLLLPLSLTTALGRSEIEAVLAHELAHLRRHDHVVNLVQRVVEAVLFFHPAVWYVSRSIRIERENCCDDRAIGLNVERHTYAASLVRVAEIALKERRAAHPAAAVSLAAIDRPSQLGRRIRRIVIGQDRPQTRLRSFWPALAAASLLTLAVPLAAAWSTQASTAEATEPRTPEQSATSSSSDASTISRTLPASPPTASGAAAIRADGKGSPIVGSHTLVRYDGIEPVYAGAIAALLDAAWQVLDADFGFDLPEVVSVQIVCHPENELRLFNDGVGNIRLSLSSPEQLQPPSESGVFNIYGLCHELGHIAMYRTLKHRDWLTTAGAEGWADYCGRATVDRVFAMLGDDLWPDAYDYRADGIAQLDLKMSSSKPSDTTIAADAWRRLAGLIGEEMIADAFAALDNADVDRADPLPALRDALAAPYEESIKRELDAWLTGFSTVAVTAQEPSSFEPETIDRARLARKPETLKHDDDRSDGKRSIAGGGHIVYFDAPEDGPWFLTRVQLFGSRYGTPRAPNENVKITLCDEDLNTITTWERPYRTFQRGEAKWYRIPVPPTSVPERFAVCFDFNPAQTKGVYVHYDDSTSGHSAVGLPGKRSSELEDSDWMIRVELDKARE